MILARALQGCFFMSKMPLYSSRLFPKMDIKVFWLIRKIQANLSKLILQEQFLPTSLISEYFLFHLIIFKNKNLSSRIPTYYLRFVSVTALNCEIHKHFWKSYFLLLIVLLFFKLCLVLSHSNWKTK